MADGPVGLLRRSFDERLAAAGVAASAALGVALNLVDWAGPGEAILVALAGSTLAFVVGAGLRAERRAEIRDQVDAVPALRPELTRILELTGRISAQYPDRNARDELRRRCRHFVEELEGLSRGQLRTASWDAAQLVERTQQCRRRMQAVTNITAVGPDWWTATLGRDYWRANTAAIARGVQITRVFIVADRTEPAFAALLAEQSAAGVRTLVLDHADAPRDLLVNMVIWDDSHAWQAEMNPFGGISGNIFHHDPGTVRRLRDLADACVERARP
ncbi:hypothetical protein J2S43_003129 [Catenuloplanes nepalensis]|uniref:DUF6879 domain-containing protein n=1 Tax=Catenuloplanes nepalensis TaxID=587533 RepID=A0ABT9MT48_9ACTN|nr:DUF6879 family protein [Catenuloplanes nepalensis]MDP9794617.1 hypothetical protein [Catenuloplanes nepalensis]